MATVFEKGCRYDHSPLTTNPEKQSFPQYCLSNENALPVSSLWRRGPLKGLNCQVSHSFTYSEVPNKQAGRLCSFFTLKQVLIY